VTSESFDFIVYLYCSLQLIADGCKLNGAGRAQRIATRGSPVGIANERDPLSRLSREVNTPPKASREISGWRLKTGTRVSATP